MTKLNPRLLAAALFAVAAALYLITLIARHGGMPIVWSGVFFLMTLTVLPAAVAGFCLGARLQRDAASVSSPRARALRGLFAGSILTALAYILGITGSIMTGLVFNGSFSDADLAGAFEGWQDMLDAGIVEVFIGIPFGALMGMAFYLLSGKRSEAT